MAIAIVIKIVRKYSSVHHKLKLKILQAIIIDENGLDDVSCHPFKIDGCFGLITFMHD